MTTLPEKLWIGQLATHTNARSAATCRKASYLTDPVENRNSGIMNIIIANNIIIHVGLIIYIGLHVGDTSPSHLTTW